MKKEEFKVSEEVVMIPIGRLLNNPLNQYLRGDSITPESCEGIATSIRENGVTVPLLVTPYRDAFYIVHGHRRRMGAKVAGLAELPCIVKELSDDAQFNLMLNENIQRQNLTLLAEARCYEKLAGEGRSLAEIERRTGVARPRVKNLLAVVTLEPEVQTYFDNGKLPLGAAPLFTQLPEREAQIGFAREASNAGWSVLKITDKLEDWAPRARRAGGPKKGASRRVPLGRLVDEQGERLTKAQALARFEPEAVFSLRDIKRAVLGSCCNECDEKRFPDICVECPLSQLLATLLDVKGARRMPEAGAGDKEGAADEAEEPRVRAA